MILQKVLGLGQKSLIHDKNIYMYISIYIYSIKYTDKLPLDLRYKESMSKLGDSRQDGLKGTIMISITSIIKASFSYKTAHNAATLPDQVVQLERLHLARNSIHQASSCSAQLAVLDFQRKNARRFRSDPSYIIAHQSHFQPKRFLVDI